MLLHADGKKHRAKARAFHASQGQSTQVVEPTSNESSGDKPLINSTESYDSENGVKSKDVNDSTKLVAEVGNISSVQRKRKHDEVGEDSVKDTKKNACVAIDGEVIQAGETERKVIQPTKNKHVGGHLDKNLVDKESSQHKIKWKKLVTSVLKAVCTFFLSYIFFW